MHRADNEPSALSLMLLKCMQTYLLLTPYRGVKVGTWYQVPTKAKSSDFDRPTKPLRDLVKMSILAHREQRGDIIWACWQPGGAGVAIKDIRRINSGAMLIMVTPDGADKIGAQLNKGPGEGMQPSHFDLALKQWLCKASRNEEAKACYVFPPVGNYTTHISGCDTKHFGEGTSGRPNCWSEQWCCEGTTSDEDPQRRPKRFLCWNGDSNYADIGSADVDESIAGKLEWRSFWQGAGAAPSLLPEEQRRPGAPGGKTSEGKGSAEVEPSATSSGPLAATSKSKGREKKQKSAATTSQVLRAKGKPSLKGNDPPCSLWQDRPGADQAPLDSDPIETWNDDDDDENKPVRASKRRKRNVRNALLHRSFRNWCASIFEAILVLFFF